MNKILKTLLIFIFAFSIFCPVFGQENGEQVEKLVKNVILDGKEVILPLYIINGNTYFKIDGALKQVGIDISFNEKTNKIEFLGHKLIAAGEKSDDKNSDNPSEENYRQPEEGEYVNCGCSCKHHSMEEYNSCPCCKGKTPLYHKEESKSESSKEEKNIETKEDEFVNCGCSCKHHSMEEYNSCPCCKGKTPQVYCDKSAKKEFKKAKNNNSSNTSKSDMDKLEPDGGMDCCCSCKCHSGQESNECQCYKDKDLHESKNDKDTQEANNEENVEVKSSDMLTDKDLKLKNGEYIDCGCGCKHHSMEEFNECPCCCGKDVHIHRLSKSEQVFDKILDFSQYAVIVLVLLSLIWFIYKVIYDSLKKNKSKK